ncbi:MAG: Crp/Fnr family transcriptional regulator [Bacilli bacterium]|nr:Crp/Fnr family transcriptional regulator [Bacilli bacterium]
MIAFKKGEILFHEGDECHGFYVVLQGRVRIVSYTLSGSEIVYNEVERGHGFGNNLVFSSDPTFRGNVIGDSEGIICFVDRETLTSLLQSNKGFLEDYLRMQSDFGKSLNGKLKLATIGGAEERFIYYLTLKQGRIRYRSIAALADSLFMKRETLSRVIHGLERDGIIKINGKEIVSTVKTDKAH